MPGGGGSESAKGSEPPSAKDALLGGLGGFGRFGRKKPKEEPKREEPKPQAQPGEGASQDSLLMEMTSEVVSYSSDPVDAAVFAIPAGFKQVEHPMKKMLEKRKR
jgi:hypothetical protein